MTSLGDLSPLEAAEQLAALSPQTNRALDAWKSARDGEESAYGAFHAIGAAIVSKRDPLAPEDATDLFAFAERLLTQGSGEVQNMIATCTLEDIGAAAGRSGFDFSSVDPYLGAKSRRYLLAWDRFNKTTTPGLSRR